MNAETRSLACLLLVWEPPEQDISKSKERLHPNELQWCAYVYHFRILLLHDYIFQIFRTLSLKINYFETQFYTHILNNFLRVLQRRLNFSGDMDWDSFIAVPLGCGLRNWLFFSFSNCPRLCQSRRWLRCHLFYTGIGWLRSRLRDGEIGTTTALVGYGNPGIRTSLTDVWRIGHLARAFSSSGVISIRSSQLLEMCVIKQHRY